MRIGAVGFQWGYYRHLPRGNKLSFSVNGWIDATLNNVKQLGKLMNMSSERMVSYMPPGLYHALSAEIAMLNYHIKYPFNIQTAFYVSIVSHIGIPCQYHKWYNHFNMRKSGFFVHTGAQKTPLHVKFERISKIWKESYLQYWSLLQWFRQYSLLSLF